MYSNTGPYNNEQALQVCELIATSQKSLNTICKEIGISYGKVLGWLQDDNNGFRMLYARAKEDQADYLAEQMMEIADDSSNDTIIGEYGPTENKEWVNRSKLRVDTRKWIAAKLKPKKYGDKIEVEAQVNTTSTLSIEQLSAIAARLNSTAPLPVIEVKEIGNSTIVDSNSTTQEDSSNSQDNT